MQNKAIEVIRHSLAAANAALDLLTPVVETVVETVVEQAPVVVVEQAPVVVVEETRSHPLSGLLLTELENSRFALRTESELRAMFALTQSQLYDALNDMDEGYTTKKRRSDGAPLVGLESRN